MIKYFCLKYQKVYRAKKVNFECGRYSLLAELLVRSPSLYNTFSLPLRRSPVYHSNSLSWYKADFSDSYLYGSETIYTCEIFCNFKNVDKNFIENRLYVFFCK